jgi:biotin-dependent carboxylase-like uncharacterized protein
MAALRVLSPGFLATVQDLGRVSFQHLGVPVSGALDTFSLRLGNALLGNTLGDAGIEMCYAGVHVEVVDGPVRVLVAGPCGGRIEGSTPRAVIAWRSERLQPGDRLMLGPVRKASCAYLIVEGGVRLAPVLGSLSTYTRGEFGGLDGRALRRGDVLPLAEATDRSEIAIATPPQDDDSPIRVIPGPQDDYFTERAFTALYGEPFAVSSAADRIGLRLEGATLEHSRPADIPSDGTVHGMIQVPPSGQPIILLSDRQTTGGYPKIATVISADLPRVGRLVPGQKLRFAPVTPTEGVRLAREGAQEFQRILATALAVPGQPGLTTDLLLSTNLVGGVVTAFEELS